MNRRQFQVSSAYTMTINKAHDQTKKVGMRLDWPAFTHGKLYVAAPWVGDPQNLNVAVNNRSSRKTSNAVYKEIP